MPDLKRTSILSTGRDPGAQKPRHAEPMRDSRNGLSRQPDGRSIPTCSSYTAVSCPHVVVTGQLGLSTSHPPRDPQVIPSHPQVVPRWLHKGPSTATKRSRRRGTRHTHTASTRHSPSHGRCPHNRKGRDTPCIALSAATTTAASSTVA